MKQIKIVGIYVKNDDGSVDVTVSMPESIAAIYGVDADWDFTFDELQEPEIMKEKVLEQLEEYLGSELESQSLDSLMDYLMDDQNWDGEIEEGCVLEGEEAVHYLLSHGLRSF